jgi:transcriptional antiterminator NusG
VTTENDEIRDESADVETDESVETTDETAVSSDEAATEETETVEAETVEEEQPAEEVEEVEETASEAEILDFSAPASSDEAESEAVASARDALAALGGVEKPAESDEPATLDVLMPDAPEKEALEAAIEEADAKKAEMDAAAAAEALETVGEKEDEEEEEVEELPPSERLPTPEEATAQLDDGIKRRWYVIHAYSGQEGNVKTHLQVLAEQQGLGDLMTNVLVPMEEVAEMKSGEKKISKRKFFPGYVLVRLPEHPERNPDLWHLIKDTPGVTGFIGSRNVPVPLEDREVCEILEEIRGERERPKPKVNFEVGERVKIIDGPFANFLGSIDEINAERGMLKVMVEIFERLTSVEVEFWQVEKV